MTREYAENQEDSDFPEAPCWLWDTEEEEEDAGGRVGQGAAEEKEPAMRNGDELAASPNAVLNATHNTNVLGSPMSLVLSPAAGFSAFSRICRNKIGWGCRSWS